jgi:hypothetical protein
VESIYLYSIYIYIVARVVVVVVVYLTTLPLFIIWLWMRGLLLNNAMKVCSRKNFWLNLKQSSLFIWWDWQKRLKFRQYIRTPCRYFKLELPEYVTGVPITRLLRSVSLRVVSGLRQRAPYILHHLLWPFYLPWSHQECKVLPGLLSNIWTEE